LAWRPQLPWLLVIGDWSDDDPGVAAQDEELAPPSCWELAELEPAAEEPVVAAVCSAAMPAPRPRKSTPLSMPAATRDRAAGWRRRTGRVPPRRLPGAGVGSWSITVPLVGVDRPTRSLPAAAWPDLHAGWELAG
jgi:hypothetical protein